MVQIEILTGPESGRVVDVESGTRTLGRAASCDIPLKDGSVSGRHLEIQVDASGSVRFRDLGSTNGTWSGGVQVQEGEWFAGSEIKLGGCAMRLVDPAGTSGGTAGGGNDADADLHRRAREAALTGGRKGGLLQLIAVLVVVAGAGGGAWWYFGGGEDAEGNPRGPRNTGGPTVEFDLIENLGDFSSPESWSLSVGVEIADSKLTAGAGRGRATLTRTFAATTPLKFRGEATGRVVPVVSWGAEGEDAAAGEWAAPALSSAGGELVLPSGADWFRVALDLAPGAVVSSLKVDEGDVSLRKGSAPSGPIQSIAGNWLLETAAGGRLMVRGARGSWSSTEGGEAYTAEGPTELLFSASAELWQNGVFLILASGGPVGLASGVVVSDSPGLLIGDETGRYLIRFDPPAQVSAADGGARVSLTGGATLLWELRPDLTEAARISRAIKDHERLGDDRALLADVARLLRDYPLVDEQVADALQRSRASMERGRGELQTLQTGTAAALFIASLQSMVTLKERADALAARFPGTEVEAGAQELSGVLAGRADEIRAADAAVAAAYRDRLQVALQSSYPLLASWLEGK